MLDKYTLKKAPNDHFQATILDMAIAKNKLLHEHNSRLKATESNESRLACK